MNDLKAILIGMLGSLIMFILLFLGIHVTGVAPFNQPPSAAFLTVLGLNKGPLALILHFLYGGFWGFVFFKTFKEKGNVMNGIGSAIGLWLVMMLILSPIIGWGVFGIHAGTHAADSPMYLEPGPKYIIMTLVLHLIYGLAIGIGIPACTKSNMKDHVQEGNYPNA